MARKFTTKSAVLFFLVIVLLFDYIIHVEGCFTKFGKEGTIDVTTTTDDHDSIYHRYRFIQDSMNNLDTRKRFYSNNPGNSFVLGPMGVSRIIHKSFKGGTENMSTDVQYYLAIS